MGSWGGRTTLLTLIAVVALGFGAYHLWDIWNFSRTASEAQGVVIERTSTRFTTEFTVGGRIYQIEESLPSTKGANLQARMRLQPGANVTVLYDRAAPQNARWKSQRNWAFPVALCFVGILCALSAFRPYWGLQQR